MNVGVSECLAGKLLEKFMSELRRLPTAKPSPVALQAVLIWTLERLCAARRSLLPSRQFRSAETRSLTVTSELYSFANTRLAGLLRYDVLTSAAC